MLNINNKMYLNRRFTAVDADFNIMLETIVTHILTQQYELNTTHVKDIEFDDVLFISDRYVNGRCLLLESNDFKESGVTIERNNFPKRVNSCHAYEFNTIDEELRELSSNINLVIIGFVNTIPEHIMTNIFEIFANSNIVVFGDPLVDAPEHNNYFMKYLTNASVAVKLEYDSYRISDKKKINNTLFKLKKDNNDINDITISNNVSVNTNSYVDTSLIEEYLFQPSSSVVLPKRLYATVNSIVYQNLTSNVKLDFQAGDVFLSKLPWCFTQNNMKYVIPPLTKIRIMCIYNQVFIDNHRCFVCDVSVEKDNMNALLVNKAIIDFTDYLLNFDPKYFPDNNEDYEEIIKFDQFNSKIHDGTILKVLFSRCFTTDMVKYYDTERTLAFIETIERNPTFSSDFNWYKIFARTTESIDIIASDEFIDIK